MARKAKKTTDSEQKTSTQVSILISAPQLNTLLKNCTSITKQTAELTGSLREKIGYAKEKQGLHSKAFSTLRQLDKMEPEKLLEYWTHLTAYMDMSGITERMESVGKLDLDEEQPEGDDVGGRPANVESLADKRARRKAAEAAGDTETETAVH